MKLRAQVRIRLLLDDEIAMGPGKVDLLEAIVRTGSIAAAAKDMEMSYRRAWLLVETMNNCFDRPLVESSRGGSGGGGAVVTETALELIKAFRGLETDVASLIDRKLQVFAARARKSRRKTPSTNA